MGPASAGAQAGRLKGRVRGRLVVGGNTTGVKDSVVKAGLLNDTGQALGTVTWWFGMQTRQKGRGQYTVVPLFRTLASPARICMLTRVPY